MKFHSHQILTLTYFLSLKNKFLHFLHLVGCGGGLDVEKCRLEGIKNICDKFQPKVQELDLRMLNC